MSGPAFEFGREDEAYAWWMVDSTGDRLAVSAQRYPSPELACLAVSSLVVAARRLTWHVVRCDEGWRWEIRGDATRLAVSSDVHPDQFAAIGACAATRRVIASPDIRPVP